MNKMTNHEKTTLVDGLFDNYNWFEKTLVFIGLERLVVFLRAQNMEGVSVEPAHDAMNNDFPLNSDGIDYD